MIKKKPREFYYALMDYGAYLGRSKTNPNRKSRHYQKQSKFEGSNRQIRGKILKLLFEKPLTFRQLQSHIESTNLQQVVQDLEQEGFLEIEDGTVKLL